MEIPATIRKVRRGAKQERFADECFLEDRDVIVFLQIRTYGKTIWTVSGNSMLLHKYDVGPGLLLGEAWFAGRGNMMLIPNPRCSARSVVLQGDQRIAS